jgi:hypothetical protein
MATAHDGLFALADVLAAARSLRTEVFRADPSPHSTAAHDLQECEQTLGTRGPVLRTVVCGDLWTAIAADQLYDVSLLIRDGTTGFGIFPLLRSVVEHSTLAVWVVDERVTGLIRGARSAVCVRRSAEGQTASMSHVYGRDSDNFRNARANLKRIQQEIQSEKASLTEPGLDAAYEKPPLPTEVVIDYGARLGNPDVWQGVYDYLCGMATHPSLDALSLAGITAEGRSSGFTLTPRLIRSVAPYAVRPYIAAISRLGEYLGWEWRKPVEAYLDRFNSVVTDDPREQAE